MSRHAAVLVALGALAVGIFLSRRPVHDHFTRTQTYEDVYYVPPEEWLPTLSLGYREALADLLWMRALIYFGDELIHQGDVTYALDYADAILALDPDFRAVYRWAGTAGMYNAVGTTVEDVQASIEFLRRGADRFPEDGAMAWDLGASLTFELVPFLDDPEAKERARAEGVAHLQAAARLGGGPPWLVLTNATQLRRLGQTEQAIRHLEEMYGMVEDESVRARIEEELTALRSQAFTEALQRSWLEHEQARQRDLPYVDSTLYLFLR